jgi:hypothetical protein
MDEELPDTIRFADRREAAADDTTVRCPRCRKLIEMHERRCEHCGLHFAGEAWEFSPSSHSHAGWNQFGMPRWLVVIAVMSLVAAVLSTWMWF